MTSSPVEAPEPMDLPDAPPIPGLRFRRLRDGDWPAIAALFAAAQRADGVPWAPTPESLRLEWTTTPGLDLADVVVVEAAGRLVAVAGSDHSQVDGVEVHDIWCHVDPDWRRRGLGRALFGHNVRRAQAREVEIAAAAAAESRLPGPRPAELGAWATDTETGHRALLDAHGFRAVRWFSLMRRPSLDAIPDLELPDGLEVRPVSPAQHRAIFDGEEEAFRDHWGHRAPTEGDFERTFAAAELDTSLWQVAWDGDQVAGVVQAWIWPGENEKLGVARGWLEKISVRRPWRRRGLARALTARGLAALRDRGMTDAMLGVDADNPTGALGLYLDLGFEVDQRSATYRRPIAGSNR